MLCATRHMLFEQMYDLITILRLNRQPSAEALPDISVQSLAERFDRLSYEELHCLVLFVLDLALAYVSEQISTFASSSQAPLSIHNSHSQQNFSLLG